jgi:hypothetical protein
MNQGKKVYEILRRISILATYWTSLPPHTYEALISTYPSTTQNHKT